MGKQWKQCQTLFFWAPKSLQMVTAAMKLKDAYSLDMSNVLLEAAATGRPVITSDIYGCREAVDEGVTGLLCTVKDADSLYEQMKKMALMPREERAQMGLDGRKKMERQFDKKLVVQNTIQAITG